MPVRPALGTQRGDEGKGRFVDELAKDASMVARFNGADNAGHTLFANGEEFDVHGLPSGILHDHIINVVGNGVLVNPISSLEEIQGFQRQGVELSPDRLVFSSIASIIAPHHIALDRAAEVGAGGQGSTVKGVRFAAGSRADRTAPLLESLLTDEGRRDLVDYVAEGLNESNKVLRGVRLGRRFAVPPQKTAKAWVEGASRLIPFIGDTVELVHDELAKGNIIIAEGAQSSSLDVNLGQYPLSSSSHPGVAGVQLGLGVSHRDIDEVLGVAKVIPSHVGKGPFATEIFDQKLSDILVGSPGDVDGEFGTTTGRRRRVGYLDLPVIRSAIRTNGITQLALTKMDLLPRFGKSTQIAVGYSTLDGFKEFAPVGSAQQIGVCIPEYVSLPLWDKDISNARKMSDLPRRAQQLIRFIEDVTQTDVRYVGVGYERSQFVNRRLRTARTQRTPLAPAA